MEPEIPKIYSPETIEPQWARQWVEQKLYRPSDDPASPRFSLTIPPPNITGLLHMGHMLEHTEIDILMRWHRMKGENVLWLPGTDHASIATQMIVERELGREALPDLEPGPAAQSAWQREGQRRRQEMGREKFIERCWLWKEENGGTIREQMKRLGASCDWTRDRFTMDPAYTRAVVEVFVRLYEEGLIYRGKYIVNWCPRCGTAVSDLEVVHEERKGKLWYIRYPIEGGGGHITVATTRPETMLGDTAVAVNPSDPRYREKVGTRVELPLLKRFIPVVADDFVDPKFGTGAVKVTPAHDPNDFEIAERHKLPRIEVINEEGRMTDKAGPYRGLDRFEARNAVVKDLTAQGLLEKIEDHMLSVGICQRCHSVVEPRLSTQWFMKMKPLAEPAIRAVEDGRIQVVPDQYRKIYLDWMGKIYDWCISRQLWWGHRIPAWYCLSCGVVTVARQDPSACTKCGSTSLRPETDVLDTWFSSALWPFATLGWPDDTPDLRLFFPQNLMIMGFDILFFWGARMIMMGMKFMNEAPFRELYIHALVRDAERQKMSKTKGNVIDPLEITEKYGTDAVRFALAISAAPGTDIVVSPDKFDSYRAFANKIWNAARFVLMNYRKLPEKVQQQIAEALRPMPGLGFDAVAAPENLALADRWIFSRLLATTGEANEALGHYRFHEAADKVYHFFWHELCDWYLEWVKPEITQTAAEPALATWINLTRVLEAALHLLHPFMPFITEELWHEITRRPREESISHAAFDLVSDRVADPISEKQFQTIQELIVAVRNAKAELSLQRQRPSVQIACEDLRVLELFRAHLDSIHRLAGIEATNFTRGRMTGETAGVHHTATFDLRILHEEKVDPAAERLRLEREREKLEQALAQSKKQLDNQSFMDRAPRDVVRGVERRNAELTEHHRKVLESLERLGKT
ncbi:MAG TPA: valine--tRNA ligase [Terriglobia bacterium]|nr:valine--tRNA ligase [Terriglobia bacterium]